MHEFVMFSITLFLIYYYICIVIFHRINCGFNLLYKNILIIVQLYFNLLSTFAFLYKNITN